LQNIQVEEKNVEEHEPAPKMEHIEVNKIPQPLTDLSGRCSKLIGILQNLLKRGEATTEQVRVQLFKARTGDACIKVDSINQGVNFDGLSQGPGI
jgi:hypothetical protein